MKWCEDPDWIESCEHASKFSYTTYASVKKMLEYIVLKLEKIEAELEKLKDKLEIVK